MPRLNPVQVAAAARAGGFTGQDVAIAVAVAWAESGWNTDAINRANSNGTVDYGLWQINSVHRFPELSDGKWKDPNVNARLAKDVHRRQGWNAWVAFGNQNYRDALGQAQAAAGVVVDAAGDAVDGVTTTPGEAAATVTDALGGALAPVAEAAQNVSGVVEWLTRPESWARIGQFAGGMVAFYIGAYILFSRPVTRGVGKVVGVVTSVVPQGKAVKAAGAAATVASSSGGNAT